MRIYAKNKKIIEICSPQIIEIYYKLYARITKYCYYSHVDHGKTTLVDRILHQVKTFRK